MGFNNPDVPWSELERRLSGRKRDATSWEPPNELYHPDVLAATGDGGDSPAWTRKRAHYEPPRLKRPAHPVPYAELHCHSNFSFLDGASHPEEIVEHAYELGLSAIAITDHDGFYGVVRFAEAARELGVRTVFGAELSIGLPGPQNGEPDPLGRHLLLLARGPEGYARLSRTISEAHLRGGEKGRPVYDLEEVAAAVHGHALLLTGCRKGYVPAALADHGPAAARDELARLIALFGADSVAVELTAHGHPLDDERNDELAELARAAGLPTVATNNVHYAAPSRR